MQFYADDFAKASFSVNSYVLMAIMALYSTEVIYGVKMYQWVKSKDNRVTAEKKL